MQHRLLITTEQQNAKAPYINETTNVYCKNSFLQRLNTHNDKHLLHTWQIFRFINKSLKIQYKITL